MAIQRGEYTRTQSWDAIMSSLRDRYQYLIDESVLPSSVLHQPFGRKVSASGG